MPRNEMIAEFGEYTAEISRALDVLLASTGPTDLCRQIVHMGLVPGPVRGCELFVLDNKFSLNLIAGYGQSLNLKSGISAWQDSILSESIRDKQMRISATPLGDSHFSVIAFPFVANNVPSGVLALLVEGPSFRAELPDGMAGLISKIALYLESIGLRHAVNGSALNPVGPESLTTRQLNILIHLESGLINIEIAKILMVSESTIRQETVKIYSALGVHNRQEAAKKARALGLLPKRIDLQAL